MYYKRIEELRLESGKTPYEVARGIGMRYNTYVRNEKGPSKASFMTLLKLAKYHNTSIHYLIGNTNNRYDQKSKNLSIFKSPSHL